MEKIYVQPNWSLIEAMTSHLAMNIVYIDNRYFQYREFLPAEEDDQSHHRVIGRDITKLMTKYTIVASNSKASLHEVLIDIESCPTAMIEFSPKFKWIRYLAS